MTDVYSNRRSIITGHAYHTLRTFTVSVFVAAKSQRRPKRYDRRLPRRTYDLTLFTVHIESSHIATHELLTI